MHEQLAGASACPALFDIDAPFVICVKIPHGIDNGLTVYARSCNMFNEWTYKLNRRGNNDAAKNAF